VEQTTFGKVVLIPKYNESSRIIQEADVVHVECYFDFCKAKKNLWMSKIFQNCIFEIVNKKVK